MMAKAEGHSAMSKRNTRRPGEADFLAALKHYRDGRATAAHRAVLSALEDAPREPVAHNLLGAILMMRNQPGDAIAAFRNALALQPRDWQAHANLGSAHDAIGDGAEAEAAYRAALSHEPPPGEAAKIHFILAGAMARSGDARAAMEHYALALERDPEMSVAASKLIHLRRQFCDWSRYGEDLAAFRDLIAREREVFPFAALAFPLSAAEHLRCATTWAKTVKAPAALRNKPRGDAGRLRVGYLSSDYRTHATAHLMAEVIERHDRLSVEVIGYGLNPDDGSEARRRLIAGFDRFRDMATISNEEAARLIHGDRLDILVDLKGYTEGARTEILAQRPTPIQVNFLGYPGTMGAKFIDYVIADPIILPMDDQPHYAEAIVHLPGCYQPNDRRRPIAETTPSRGALGLPDDAFVFCCFNNPYKITPEFFDVWMRLLRTVEPSVLWLIDGGGTTTDNLRREAAARGVAADRLIFAPKAPLSEHLARHRRADLALDTLPYGAHTTGSDALWAGLPMVTCRGDGFAGRVGASLLTAAGLPELIAPDLAGYEALAARLARDGGELAGLRDRLARDRATAPLFDGAVFAGHLEAAYRKMRERYDAGRRPHPFKV